MHTALAVHLCALPAANWCSTTCCCCCCSCSHVDVPTLSGVRPIAVPACSLNQDVLILPGYGVPRLSSLGRGSLKVHLRWGVLLLLVEPTD
jgi:hypothetical protein